jgi:hypothetical protein
MALTDWHLISSYCFVAVYESSNLTPAANFEKKPVLIREKIILTVSR